MGGMPKSCVSVQRDAEGESDHDREAQPESQRETEFGVQPPEGEQACRRQTSHHTSWARLAANAKPSTNKAATLLNAGTSKVQALL